MVRPRLEISPIVIPANAGTQLSGLTVYLKRWSWVPAFAGMTGVFTR